MQSGFLGIRRATQEKIVFQCITWEGLTVLCGLTGVVQWLSDTSVKLIIVSILFVLVKEMFEDT